MHRIPLTPASRLSLMLLASACSRPTSADLVVFGKVWTGDSTRPYAQAVAARGDTIIAVGDSATVARLVGDSTRVLQNGPALVTPGFMDAHVHFLSGGYQLSVVDLRLAASPAEFTRLIESYTAERPHGEWILGGDWDHERWPGAPLPTREWIDSVTPNNPVFISRLDGHMALANSLALRAAGISRSTRDIPGGVIVRDPRTHEPTGILKDNAQEPVYAVIPDPTPAQDDAALARALAFANTKGVTAVAAMSSAWSEYAAVQRARAAGTLTVRIALFPALSDWRRVADTVRAHGPGDDWVRLAGVKAFMDGSLGSTTALFFDPYVDDPSTSGLQRNSFDSMRVQIGAADSAGLQIAVHAIGERANAVLLEIYDSVAAAHGPRDRRFRIEHAQHLRPRDRDRLVAQGVIASMQPYHAIDDGRWAEKRIGPERIKNMYVFRSLLDAKARLVFGSDWTVAPLDPILGLYAAVTRRTLDGKNPGGWLPAEKISLDDALRAYTVTNAYGVFAESTRGVLKPGYHADLVLLDQDLFSIAPEAIETARIRATVAGGKVVYQATP